MTDDDSSSAPNSPTESSPEAPRSSISSQRLSGLKRNRLGCLNCRRRRRKCNEQRPSCQACVKRREACQWPSRYVFKDANARPLSISDPSTKQTRKLQNQNQKENQEFAILDVTADVIREHQGISSQSSATAKSGNNMPSSTGAAQRAATRILSSDYSGRPIALEPQPKATNETQARSSVASSASPLWVERIPAPPNAIRVSMSSEDYPTDLFSAYGFSNEASVEGIRQSFGESPADPSRQQLESSTSNQLTNPENQWIGSAAYNAPVSKSFNESSLSEAAAEELLSLRYTAEKAHHKVDIEELSMASHSGIFNVQEDLASVHYSSSGSPDGIFLPGSAYEELHTNLRQHMLTWATTDQPFVLDISDRMDHDLMDYNAGEQSNRIQKLHDGELASSSPASISLLPKQEFILWKNYVEEVAPWLDKFDNGKVFQNQIPTLAARQHHLKYSILALSARQMERKDPSQSSSGSLALYQKAIHLLLPDIVTKNSGVIASCVILCVLEMMSCNPKEWRRHLDGCAVLLNTADIHGSVGGLNQALFWCYARMDVCGGLISEEVTNIPIEKWTAQTSVRESRKYFHGPNLSFDMYANYAVFLLARVLRLLFGSNHQKKEVLEPLESWQDLYAELERWRRDRPDEILPILTVSVSKRENESPFPTVLFGATPSISANQLYHTGAILMLQKKPKRVRLEKDSKSLIWHARQICGIAESNTHHGSWINALQPLYISGKIMSHPSEHIAILKILEKIELETGWGTKWRADDLLNFWGNDEE